jgi:hypothetical protein
MLALPRALHKRFTRILSLNEQIQRLLPHCLVPHNLLFQLLFLAQQRYDLRVFTLNLGSQE